jgi:hypothetical protein
MARFAPTTRRVRCGSGQLRGLLGLHGPEQLVLVQRENGGATDLVRCSFPSLSYSCAVKVPTNPETVSIAMNPCPPLVITMFHFRVIVPTLYVIVPMQFVAMV